MCVCRYQPKYTMCFVEKNSFGPPTRGRLLFLLFLVLLSKRRKDIEGKIHSPSITYYMEGNEHI